MVGRNYIVDVKVGPVCLCGCVHNSPSASSRPVFQNKQMVKIAQDHACRALDHGHPTLDQADH